MAKEVCSRVKSLQFWEQSWDGQKNHELRETLIKKLFYVPR